MDDPACSRSASWPALVAGFAALYFLWGSTYLGIKFAVETIPPFLMAGGRFVLAGGVLYSILRLRGRAAPSMGQWRAGALTGALLLVGGNGLVTWGQQTVPSGQAALIVATTPIWMVLLAWVFYRGERPSGRVWVGMIVGFLGAVLLIKPSPEGEAVRSVAGLVALAMAPLAWSLGSLEARRKRPAEDALLTSAMQMLTGGGMMLVVGVLLGEGWRFSVAEISVSSWMAFLYLTFFGGLVGFSTYAWLLRVASPTAVSTYAYVNPLVAVVLGWSVAGEVLETQVLLAAALILGAVVLITLPGSRSWVTRRGWSNRYMWRLLPVQTTVSGESIVMGKGKS